MDVGFNPDLLNWVLGGGLLTTIGAFGRWYVKAEGDRKKALIDQAGHLNKARENFESQLISRIGKVEDDLNTCRTECAQQLDAARALHLTELEKRMQLGNEINFLRGQLDGLPKLPVSVQSQPITLSTNGS